MTNEEAEDILSNLEKTMDQRRIEKINQGLPTHEMDLDIELSPELVHKIRSSNIYAQNLYAAMCNVCWQERDVWEILKNETWSCSWRSAGAIIARLRGMGDYMDWYCSGIDSDERLRGSGRVIEGTVTQEIANDLAKLGWIPIYSK